MIHSSPNQVVRALEVLYELLKNSHPREHVQAVLLEWGAEQLYCLLLTPNFGDEAREMVFRVGKTDLFITYFTCTANSHVIYDFYLVILQLLYKILKSERVSERNKQRIKLKDFGYVGLICCLEDIPVTMTTVRCLYEQVLATGNYKTVPFFSLVWIKWVTKRPFSKHLKTSFQILIHISL